MSFQDVRAGRSQHLESVEDERSAGMSDGGGVRRGAGTAATRTTCKVDDCGRDKFRRGWCQAHYERLRQHGDVLAHIPVVPGGGPLHKRKVDGVPVEPDPSCVDCGDQPWGGTIRCRPCLDADLTARLRAKRDPYGDRHSRPSEDRTCVVQVRVPPRSTKGAA